MEHKFRVSKSGIQGKGIFATKPIKKGELICYMEGEQVSSPELKKRYNEGKERVSDPLQIRSSTYLDLYEPYLFFNHSCHPNSFIKDLNSLVAFKNIKIGEEITYDYSLTEWADRRFWSGNWSMKCSCGFSKCRKIIKEISALPKNVQDKFVKKGFVQNHIIDKYKKVYEI